MKLLQLIGVLAGLGFIAVLGVIGLMPWMDRWGASEAEFTAALPGDELVPSPAVTYTRAVTIDAPPQAIYPWLVQMGAERGGLYSYSWFETNVLRCELINADRIHTEWQGLTVGDLVKMCPGDWGPPAYEVANLLPNEALILGHQENGAWSDSWQFVLVPQAGSATRLVVRGRDMKTGGIWDLMRPGQFIMERGMLLGIKARAESLAESGTALPVQEYTPTPEVFIPLEEAIPEPEIILEGVQLELAGAELGGAFPPGCSGEAPACTPAQDGFNFISVVFTPRDLPEGQMLAYKHLPAVRVNIEGGASVPYSLTKYDNASHALTLGFEVPESASVFGLQWGELSETPLEVVTR